MVDLTSDSACIPIAIACEQGLLHGEMTLLADSQGFIVLPQITMAANPADRWLTKQFRNAGFSTLGVELLAPREEQFLDIHNNVHLLARRLVGFLELIKHRLLMGEIREQPIGLFASNAVSPVAVQVAALRDRDIAAIVCHEGLIDLAGALYLRSLTSPLLLLMEEESTQHAISNRHALNKMACPTEFVTLSSENDHGMIRNSTLEACSNEAIRWFRRYLGERPCQ